jgi:hypothetical protein
MYKTTRSTLICMVLQQIFLQVPKVMGEGSNENILKITLPCV